jgi:cysteinyl-tRNA synthetase
VLKSSRGRIGRSGALLIKFLPMGLKIYNTLSGKLEEFVPINPPEVKIYVCGVTVYDDSHVGHGRSLIVFDVFRRYLEHLGYKVKFVRNFTDVDDKIINRAKGECVPFMTIANRYIASYYEDMEVIGVKAGGRGAPRQRTYPGDHRGYIQAY